MTVNIEWLGGGSPGVTVITATNKPGYLKNLFNNFNQQRWGKKELIIILNNDKLKIDDYRKYAEGSGQVSVYRLPERAPLGACLNFGIRKAKHGYIAKFDDDDYYGPLYLTEAMRLFKRTKADLIGKRKFYMYFKGPKRLLIATKPSLRSVAGATLMFRKSLFPAVKFSRMRKGSDMRFLLDCRRNGAKIRSTSQYHYVAIRRANQTNHTWKINMDTLKNLQCRTVARTTNFRTIVSRNP